MSEHDTQAVMHKTLQLARHQLGLPSAQAFCEHEWATDAGRRECTKCRLTQVEKTVWVNVNIRSRNA